MSQWGYVALGWAIGVAVIATYVVVVLRRGRHLSEQVPPDQRRWL